MPNDTVVRWRAHLRFEVSTSTGTHFDVEAAGEHAAAKPSELLLVALCGCTGMDVVSILRKKRETPSSYVVSATADQRRTHPRTFETIDVEHRFSGATLNEAAVARSIELSARRYCLVNAHLSAGETRITHRYVIEGDEANVPARSGVVVVTGPNGAGLERGGGPAELQPLLSEA